MLAIYQKRKMLINLKDCKKMLECGDETLFHFLENIIKLDSSQASKVLRKLFRIFDLEALVDLILTDYEFLKLFI